MVQLKPIRSDWTGQLFVPGQFDTNRFIWTRIVLKGQVNKDRDSFYGTLLITLNSGIQDDLSKQGIEIEGFGSKIAALDARVNEVFEQMKSLLAESQEQT